MDDLSDASHHWMREVNRHMRRAGELAETTATSYSQLSLRVQSLGIRVEELEEKVRSLEGDPE